MVKRLFCLLSVVIVSTSSVFAWDAYSFTGVYKVQQLNPSLMTAVSSNTPDSGSFDLTSGVIQQRSGPDSDSPYGFDIGLVATGDTIVGTYTVPVGSVDTTYSYFYTSDNHYTYGSPYNGVNLAYDATVLSDPTLDYFWSAPFTVTFSIPVSGDYTSVSFEAFLSNFNAQFRLPAWGPDIVPTVEFYVNDTLMGSYLSVNRTLNVAPLYHVSQPITSLKIVISVPASTSSNGLPDNKTGSVPVSFYVYFSNSSYINYSLLGPESALDGFTDQAQDDINSHESVESQWTGSMSSNFDALDMDSFTFPSGLLSGFALITGIFQDLWNGMGDYKILYVFPLFLGIALLLIGRISKFSGGQSSSRSNRGDDDA